MHAQNGLHARLGPLVFFGFTAGVDRARARKPNCVSNPFDHSYRHGTHAGSRRMVTHTVVVIYILVRAARAGDCGAVYEARDHGLPTLRVCAALAAAGPQRGTRCLTIAKDATPHNLASEKQNARAALGSAAPAGRRQTAGRRKTSGARRLDCHSCAPSRTVSKRPSLAPTPKGGARERGTSTRALDLELCEPSRCARSARVWVCARYGGGEGVGMGRRSAIEQPHAVEGSERRSHQQGRARAPP